MGFTKSGARVLAIQSADEKQVFVFGRGTYVGDEIPHENAAGMAVDLREMGIPNPKISLDNGKDVFGCECYWGPIDVVEKRIAGHEEVEVDIDAVRRDWREKASKNAAGQNG